MDPFSGVHCFSGVSPYLLKPSQQQQQRQQRNQQLKALLRGSASTSPSVALPLPLLLSQDAHAHVPVMDTPVIDTPVVDTEPNSSNENSDTAVSSLDSSLELAERNVPISLAQVRDLERHMSFLPGPETRGASGSSGRNEELLMTPLLSGPVLRLAPTKFPQYGLLAQNLSRPPQDKKAEGNQPADHRILLNVSTPWSAFICGSQGSGKSHTLSCLLESCLITKNSIGSLSHPLTGIVFHWDRFTSYANGQVCEAAYLCSSGIPVRVLVSPTNYWRMKEVYENLPGIGGNIKKPTVIPMMFQDQQLDIKKMMDMMALTDKEGPQPLYVEVIMRILREMAIESRGATGLNYKAFRQRLEHQDLTPMQLGPLKLRLDILESFMESLGPPPGYVHPAHNLNHPVPQFAQGPAGEKKRKAWMAEREKATSARARAHLAGAAQQAWQFAPGSLTIVDLSCPFVEESMACTLFGIALDIFLEHRGTNVGRIVALDEAHKFMTASASAAAFTEKLLQIVRLQRHLATRVVVATQEPTISPKLLDLATLTIVHRFTSPEWMQTLRAHLAGVSLGAALSGKENDDEKTRRAARIFEEIVGLDAGEALLFSPAAMLDVAALAGDTAALEPKKLGSKYVKMRVRKRLTADGGRSILAV